MEYTGPSDFVHLHNHTIFSLLDGVASPEAYFSECAKRGWKSFAITEHGVLNSIPDAYLMSKQYKIKYIPGIELYYNDMEQERRAKTQDESLVKGDIKSNKELYKRYYGNRHLTTLIKNNTGYSNLLKINKRSWEEGFYYKPRTWFDSIAKDHEGLIILSGCLNGPISYELRTGYKDRTESTPEYVKHTASEYIKKFVDVFGDDFYIELQMPGVDIAATEDQEEFHDYNIFKALWELAQEHKIKCVLTNDTHYIEKEDWEVQKIMMAIEQDTVVNDPKLFYSNSNEQYLKTRAQLWERFKTCRYHECMSDADFERICDNTLEVADKCSEFKPNTEPKLQKFSKLGKYGDPDRMLYFVTMDGLKKRGLYNDTTKFKTMDGNVVTYKEQALLELKRFIDKEFSSYFLITRDLIQHSNELGYPVGPGRGSAGGSLVCWLIGITAINSITAGLSFDRFLSGARGGWMLNVSMPKK